MPYKKYYKRKPRRNYRKKPKQRLQKKDNSYYKQGGYLTVPRTMKADYNCVIYEDQEHNILLANSTLGETFRAKTFRFDRCHLKENYVALWDQYRINQVEVLITPIMVQQVTRPYDDTTTANIVNAIPRYVALIDVDSTGASTFEEMENAANSCVKLATQSCKLKFTPRITVSNTVNWVSNTVKPILDMTNTLVEHNGFKIVMESASPSTAYTVRVQTRYYMSFFNKRH